MKKSEMRKYFKGKLKFKDGTNTRHDSYLPEVNGKIGLPRLFTVSRGNGDIARNNLKGIAVMLGLTERELKISVQCGIGILCTYISLCASILDFCVKNLTLDPIAHREGSVAMANAISSLLDFASNENSSGPNSREQEVLKRIKRKIETTMEYPELEKAAEYILMVINRYENQEIGK